MRRFWNFAVRAFNASLVWMLAVSDAPPLGIAVAWLSLTILHELESPDAP